MVSTTAPSFSFMPNFLSTYPPNSVPPLIYLHNLHPLYLVVCFLVMRLAIPSAAAFAGCSPDYVRRLLKKDKMNELCLLPNRTIRADLLKKLINALRSRPRRGRRFGTRFLFRLPPYRKPPSDDWRVSRVLVHLGEIQSAEAAYTIMETAFQRYQDLGGVTPAGSPKI